MPLAIVHHANQSLITDGYDDRDGIDVIGSGYAAVLRLHARYAVPASLHLSGTLVETLAWHRPDVLALIRVLARDGLIHLVGGSYAAAILTAFDDDYIRRQLRELLQLYARHLGVSPEELRTAWVPERVWDTERLAPLFADVNLPNGGYRRVLLDDRLLFPAAPSYETSPRARFDATGPYAAPPLAAALESAPDSVRRVHRIAGGHGLAIVPISAALRYAVPPRDERAWEVLAKTATALQHDPAGLLTFADDLERVAGVGGWDVTARDAYADFLGWVVASGIPVAHLGEAVEGSAEPTLEQSVEPGTYYELAREWSAGEDCATWIASEGWRPYWAMLARSIEAVREAERRGGDPRLVALAWKHVLASGYETAWQDRLPDGRRAIAGWARATASHSRAALVIAEAALRMDRAEPRAELRDVDEDGETELVLASGELFAVISPRHGARVTYLFARDALVIGNPTDDWNLEESLHSYLDAPPNHPGAFADVAGRRDRYLVERVRLRGGTAFAVLRNIEFGSNLYGLRKSFTLDACALTGRYRHPAGSAVIETDLALSPDYLGLLREGREALHKSSAGPDSVMRCGHSVVRVRGDRVALRLASEQAGHAVVLRARIAKPGDRVMIACDPQPSDREERPVAVRAAAGEL